MPVPTVLVDASCLTSEDSATRGFGRYVNALLESVPDDPRIRLAALAPAGAPVPGRVDRVTLRPITTERFAFQAHIARLGRAVARARPDVFHQPTNEPPLWCSVPWIQTLHDVIPLIYPDPGYAMERRRWKVRALAMRRASAVIAISRFSADAGIRHLGLRPDRITVILHGVNPIFAPGDAPRDEDRPYLLYVGEYGPHKGMAEAVQVTERLREKGYPHRLQIAGNVHPSARSQVEALVASSPQVEHIGRVTDEKLADLYRSATALLFTSRSEGFGRPPIEAMASGTPVIGFANTSIPEIIADGGVIVADGDVAAATEAVRQLIDDPTTRADLSAAALRRAQVFDWARCAAEHVELYTQVAGR